MSYFPVRERIFSEKFKKAQEIREYKAQSITMSRLRNESVRESLEKSSERLHRLEETLRKVHILREHKLSIKNQQLVSKKLNEHKKLKEKIKRIADNQELKLFLKKIPNYESRNDPQAINSPIQSEVQSPQNFSKPRDSGFLSLKRISKYIKLG